MSTKDYDLSTPLQEVGETTKDDKQWGMLAHLGTFLGAMFPFANIIVPIIIWQVYKDKSDFVTYHGKESLNFQLTLLIYYIVAGMSIFVLIGFVLLPIVIVFSIIYTVIAGIKANEGEKYEYPLTIRFIK